MEIRWTGKRMGQRSYLGELLDIVNGTGRRISVIVSCGSVQASYELLYSPHLAIPQRP